MNHFFLTMHQASEGDCLVLAWGDPADPHHAVIDLGRGADYRALRPWLAQASRIELFTMSHIDADHIAGAMPMVRESTAPFAPADVWFNGYAHLAAAKARWNPLEALSVPQGDKLEEGINRFGWPWNAAFAGGRVSVDNRQALVPLTLPGGLKICLLSPGDQELATLEKIWNKWLRKTRLRTADEDEETSTPPALEVLSVPDVNTLAKAPFKEDDAAPNGSSIAFLAEFDGRCVLLGADAFPSRVAASLRTLGYSPERRLKLDLLKLSHHGSKGNTSPELLALIDCTRFAISTNGTQHSHPDPETIARILAADPGRPKQLLFNTRQPNAEIWENIALMTRWNYVCIFPDPPAHAGLEVEISRFLDTQ